MPRLPRIDIPGLPQHLVVRGHNRSDIFFADLDRKVFLKYVKETLGKVACELHAYVLMTNHVHLLATGREAGAISALMHSVERRYSRYVNRTRERTGSLFDRRFYSSLVQTETYLLACMRYIESNPIRAGLVVAPWLYPWSSYRDNASGSPRGLLQPHPEYMALGADGNSRSRAYRGLFDVQLAAAFISEFRRGHEKGEAVGSEPFKARLERETGRPVVAAKPGRPSGPCGGAGAARDALAEKSNLVLFPQP